MQTLRKRTSPCKYKNDPSRFLGEGITFKAKLIGILEVSEARGDKMCQDALNDLKTAIRAAGEHKQRITISISIDGLRLRDEKTGDCLYHHPVHKISFIAQDMSDSRAFGYIFGSPDTGHRFFGIKTDKTASQVVISMRDLFQVVFELKKREIEMTKNFSDSHFAKFGTSSFLDTVHFTKEELEKAKVKYANVLKSRCAASKSNESNISEYKGPTSEAIADLLDLEHELNSIQQGINQMDKITPSDPFGPLSRGELYLDPFDDSFPSKADKQSEEKSAAKTHAPTYHSDEQPEHEKQQSYLPASSSTGKTFFSQFSPGIGKPKAEDSKWFDQETESLFNDTANANNLEPTSSPVTLNPPATEPVQTEDKKSPVKTDLFTELDPLGTGRVKPYVDKKDFFQELKNPPKKVLKELIGENSITESAFFFSPTHKEDNKTPSAAKSDSAQSTTAVDSIQGFRENSLTPKYVKMDPFEDGDPFDKTDPFQGEGFSLGEFPPLFNTKSSTDGPFDEKPSWKFDEDKTQNSPANVSSLFTASALRVSLPPEKSTGSPTGKLKSPSDSPEDSKGLKRKHYQTLRQNTLEGNEDSPVHEEAFLCTRITPASKESERKSPFKEKFRSLQSPPSFNVDKSKAYSSFDVPEVPPTPDPPPRNKSALFSIKPPPLPPKKSSQLLKPPARPPSIDSGTSHYDSLGKKDVPEKEDPQARCVQLKKATNTKKESSEFPVLLPPPTRKSSADGIKIASGKKIDKAKTTSETAGSVLNLKLNQLDNTGLENLAITLGVPSENIYSMTLQELTKMLAGKFLTKLVDSKPEEFRSDSFEVDFDANFAKVETDPNPPPPSFDKYAVFKELMEKENKPPETLRNVNDDDENDPKTEEPEMTKDNSEGPTEDKYAALRQLSVKTETCSEELEEEVAAVRPISDVNPSLEDFPPAGSVSAPDASDAKSGWTLDDKNEISETNEGKSAEEDASKFPNESQLFPLVDEFSDERKLASPRDNWATFEKPDFEQLPNKKSESFNENENSPFSSDGKECGDFNWYQKNYRRKTRKDVPWKDDDESWDDNSPKESFCSDESSREEPSPDGGRIDRYEKWNLCKKLPKWNEKGSYWGQRGAWQEETEDEFEETWRKREKSYKSDRKSNFWQCENRGKRYECCNSRDEPWDERFYCRRKRSESDTEFRKRCDSDVSDKECAWSSQKNYPDSLGRSGKQKQYYSSAHSYREYLDHCHESRSKYRKAATQKRPSSTSDSKRNFEKLYSPGEYSCRGSENRKPDKEEHKYQYCKDYRHRMEEEYPHYYKSYDRKVSGHHSKAGSRSSRGSGSGQTDAYSSFGKRSLADFGSFEALDETSRKHGKSASPSHFPFDSETENFNNGRKSEQEFQKTSERLANQWATANGKTDEKNGFFTARDGNESFANFKEEFETSGKSSKANGKEEQRRPEAAKPQTKTKPHLPILGRQESSSTLRKSDSINIFSRDNDPFEGDDFFSSAS